MKPMNASALMKGDRVTATKPIQGFYKSGMDLPSMLPTGGTATILHAALNNGRVEIKYRDARGRKAKAIIDRRYLVRCED